MGPDLHNSILDTLGFGRFQIIAVIVGSISTLADGLEIGLISTISSALQNYWGLSDTEVGLIGFIAFCGLPIGAAISGVYSDQLGRLIFIKAGTIVLFVSSIASAFMPDPWSFAFTRMIANGSIGVLIPSCSAYIAELSPPAIRGRMMYFTFTCYFFGKIASILILMLIMPNLEESRWRLAVLVLSLPSGLAVPPIYMYLVETPYMLLQLGASQEAIESMRYIMKANKRPELSPEECTVYLEADLHDSSYTTSKRFSMLFRPPYLQVTILLSVILIANNFAGALIRFVLSFTLEATLGKSKVLLGILIFDLLVLPALIPGYYLIDWHLGGRKLTMIAAGLFSTVMLVVSILTIYELVFIFMLGLVHAGFILVSNAALAYNTEIFPTKIRSAGISVPLGISRVIAVTAPLVALPLDAAGIQWPYIVATIITMVGLAASFLLPVETRGTSLDSNSLKEES
jgi:putative MFS transporter